MSSRIVIKHGQTLSQALDDLKRIKRAAGVVRCGNCQAYDAQKGTCSERLGFWFPYEFCSSFEKRVNTTSPSSST